MGAPLTSHDVVIETIAATRTQTGLRVEARLDRGDNPTGIAISKDRFAALPLVKHETHGQWNYTLLPEPADTADALPVIGEAHGVADRRRALLTRLADPRLTGLSGMQLAELCSELARLQAARAQERYSEQRGGRARRATGKLRGSKPLFDDAARVMLTLLTFPQKLGDKERVVLAVLYLRKLCTLDVLADVSRSLIGNAVREIRPLLVDGGLLPPPATTRYRSAAALLATAHSEHGTPAP